MASKKAPEKEELPPHVVVFRNGESVRVSHNGITMLETPTLLRMAAIMVEKQLGIRE